MSSNQRKSNKFVEFFVGNGFYIVLFLCIAAIAVSAYILFFTGDSDEETLELGDSIETLELGPEIQDAHVIVPDSEAQEAIAPAIQTETPVKLEAEKPVIKPTPVPTETPAPVKPAGTVVYVWPVNGEVIVPFAIDELIKSKTMGDWRTHDGIDISAPSGAKVSAIADGIVEDIYNDEWLGTTVVIDHGNTIKSFYSNLMPEVTVTKGKKVSAGDTIAGIGDTALREMSEAPHLHLSITKNGAFISPLSVLPKK